MISKRKNLSELTNIGLGGEAKFFVVAKSVDEVKEALTWARENNEKVFVLGGGSNLVFSDDGFNGLVVKIDLGGVEVLEESDSEVLVKAGAGEDWEEFVQTAIKNGWAGVECMSGIPGSVGAVPVQNVGAYGQDASETIVTVSVLDKESLELSELTNAECEFGYRMSRFKGKDAGRYVILRVVFKLHKSEVSQVKYPALQEELGRDEVSLAEAREATLTMRRRKSMLVDANDVNSRSCGSFFVNPVLSKEEFSKLRERIADDDTPHPNPLPMRGEGRPAIPHFIGTDEKGEETDKVTVPTAWLIEQAGFKKGQRHGGVGISENHVLALVNFEDGKTQELLELAREIQDEVRDKFGIELQIEPVVVK